MGKKRKVADTKVAKAAEESPVKKSPPVGKRKKESGSVTQRLHYQDSDCESGGTSFLGVTLKCTDSLSNCWIALLQ